ncbi:MAG: peptidylprolyl isomerase [Candidatus Zixiibacteriota bacterium]
MVMKVMRASTKPVLWIVVAAFVGTIIFAWGMEFTSRQTARGIVGEVNGKELRLDDYSFLYQNALAQYQQQNGEVSDEDAQRLRDDVFEQMVSAELMQEVLNKHGITVSNRELAEHLRRFPPREVQTLEIFMTNGQFDYNKYLQAYQNPDPQLWVQIEALMRPRLLQQKLYEYVTSTARVTDAEVRELYDAATERVRVRYILANTTNYRDSVAPVDSSAIVAYYESHQSEFAHGERARLKNVSIAKAPSREDSLEVEREIKTLADRARSGEDFAELARQYSEDGSASAGGSMGWFGKGAMVPAFEAAAFALDSGQVSDPFLSQFGYHIVRCEGRRGIGDSMQVNASHILMRVEPSSGTLSDLRIKAEQFVSDAQSSGFDSAAAHMGLSVANTGWFERDDNARGFATEPAVREFAFSAKIGTISQPMEVGRNILIAMVEGREPAGVAPLADVSSRIRGKLLNESRVARAAAALEPVLAQVKGGAPLVPTGLAMGFAADSTPPFGRFDPVPRFGDDPKLRGAAFALSPANRISPVVTTSMGGAILEYMDKTTPDPQQYAQKRDSIMNAAVDGKVQMVYNNWYTELRQEADVKDFRYQLPEGGY